MGWLDNLSDETRMELERHSKVAAIASLAPGFISYAAKLDAEAAAFDIEARARGYVPEKTCQVKYDEHGIPRCGECKCVVYDEYIDAIVNFCSNCGARVKEE